MFNFHALMLGSTIYNFGKHVENILIILIICFCFPFWQNRISSDEIFEIVSVDVETDTVAAASVILSHIARHRKCNCKTVTESIFMVDLSSQNLVQIRMWRILTT